MIILLRSFFIFVMFLTFGISVLAQPLSGKVISITDGDTFKMLTIDSTQIIVRVANIDCPERKQVYSRKAKEFTSNAIFGKQIKLEVIKKDRYGRLVALVYYDMDKNLSEELLTYGLAWHFVKYSKDKQLAAIEFNAKSQKLGLWQELNPIPPWEWRNGVRN